MPNEISYPYQLDQSFSILRVVANLLDGIFPCYQNLIEPSVSKKWRAWSDAVFCGVWSGSALFADVP